MTKKILILPGDGIGQEVTSSAQEVLDYLMVENALDFSITHMDVGGTAYEKQGSPLPADVLAEAKASDAILFGAVGAPQWDDLDWDYISELQISHFDIQVTWDANGGAGGGRQVTFEVSSENNTSGESQNDGGNGGTIVTVWAVNQLPEMITDTADSAEDLVQSYETPGEWMGGKFTYSSESLGSIALNDSIDYTISLTYYTWELENIREIVEL